MTKKEKSEMMELLIEFHEEVAKPTMEMMIKNAKEEIKDDLGAKIDVIDLKLTKMLDRHSEKNGDYEERISSLEDKGGSAHKF